MNPNAPLPYSPPDAEVSVTIGPVTITTYNPVTITGLEYSTNLYFVARNNGDQAVTLRCIPLPEDLGRKLEWIFHFFSFQAEAVELEPGAERTLEFLVTNEGEGETGLPFRFRVEETDDQETILHTLRSLDPVDVHNLPLTAAITGCVTGADGQPVPNVEVKLYLYNGRQSPDGEQIIAGFGDGQLVVLNREGRPPWEAFIGEFPMLLEIDADYNVYAAGKNRELFSFDVNGNLRWRRRIPNHVVTAGPNNMSADGKLIVPGTVGGLALRLRRCRGNRLATAAAWRISRAQCA